MNNRNYLHSEDSIMRHWLDGTSLFVEFDKEATTNYPIDSSDFLTELLYKNEYEIYYLNETN